MKRSSRSIQGAGRSLDTQRLGMAVSYPGIDPRTWVSLAIVTLVNVDPQSGPFVDVTLMPSQLQGTARVGAALAGGAFGKWDPLRVDDEVIVIVPNGEPAHGMVVCARLWSQADLPPQAMIDYPDDPLIQARDGTSIRVIATGDGAQISVSAPVVDVEATNGDATIGATGKVALNASAVGLGNGASHAVPLGDLLAKALYVFANACSGSTTDPTLVAAAGVLMTALYPSGPSAPSPVLSAVSTTA